MSTSRSHPHHSLPAPVVHAGFSVTQSKSHVLAGVQDAYWSDDEAEDAECPLCLEEMDVSDLNFKPCVCGYQVCLFCWHHIKENLNKRCPACRRIYTDDAVEFKPIATQDHRRLTQQKKQRERERKELDTLGRRHLANVRVVQRNVVYVVGIGPRFAKEELIPTLRSNEYFGQYGKITKILIVKRTPSGGGAPVIGLYITYHRREDAARSITAVDGAPSPGGARGEVMRASYGTTKYCMAFLRGVSCNDHSCMNLHEWGDEKDCFTKEDLTTLKHTMKTTESRIRGASKKGDEHDGLPRAASWAQRPISTSSNYNHASGPTSSRQTKRTPTTRQPRMTQATMPPTSDFRSSTNRISSQDSKPSVAPKVSSPGSSSRPATPASSLAPQESISPELKDRQSVQLNAELNVETPFNTPDPPVQIDEEESGPPSFTSPSPAPRPESTDSTQSPLAQPVLPPGLPIVPPGLSVPPSFPPPTRPSRFDTPSPQTPLLASQSSYQMSTAARALLDDVKARRELAFLAATAVSPFPDFDRTLQTLSEGDNGGFKFNLDPALAGSDTESSNTLPDFDTEAGAPFHAFPALRIPAAPNTGFSASHGLPYPHHPNRSIYDPHILHMASTAGLENSAPNASYMGSFNPFADSTEDPPTSSTSAPTKSQHPSMDDDSSRKVSRFGFARGRQGSTAASSPLQMSSTLIDASQEGQSSLHAGDNFHQQDMQKQLPTNGRQDYYVQLPSNSRSPLTQHIASPMQPHSHSRFQPFDSGVSEAQLRNFIQSSRDRAQSSLTIITDSHPLALKANQTQFNDPAIMSARFASEGGFSHLTYGPPPGLSYPQGGPNAASGTPANSNHSADGFIHVSPTVSSSPSLALSSSDFPALIPSSKEPNSRDDPVTDDAKSQQDIKAQADAKRRAAKRAAAAVKAAERQRIVEEKAAVKAADRAKATLEKQLEKEKKIMEKSRALAIQEQTAKEQLERGKAVDSKMRAENERISKERASQSQGDKATQTRKAASRQNEQKRLDQPAKLVRQAVTSNVFPVLVPVPVPNSSGPEPQVPLLSKKPKKSKPPSKHTKVAKEEGPKVTDASTVPLPTSEALAVSSDSSSSDSRSHSLERISPTPLEDLLDDIDISNPELDLPNHPFFDIHRLSPAANVPLEYGPLVHALSALSVGGGSFANSMPSGSIDNAVSSFQQLLETLTQTISDLLRLLPRTTWDDSSSFDGVLRDMLKGDDFLDDGGDEGHGKEDEVTALTLALERRARWMEVQLSKLEELHRDINTAAVRAVLSFNDNGWDRNGFLPRVGHTLRRFDNIGLIEGKTEGDEATRFMTADELEEKLDVAKEVAMFAETQVREMMERIQAVKPMGSE